MSTTLVDAGHATRSLSCLLVEDDQGFAELLRAAIKDEGFEVKHCGSFAQARTALAGRSFDLAVLDNHLPDGKGFDFYFELTRRGAIPNSNSFNWTPGAIPRG